MIAHGKPDEVRRDEEVLRAYLGRNAQASMAGVGRPMLLEFKDVDTYYGDLHVLKQVNYSIGEGEIVSLLGGNPSGKSPR